MAVITTNEIIRYSQFEPNTIQLSGNVSNRTPNQNQYPVDIYERGDDNYVGQNPRQVIQYNPIAIDSYKARSFLDDFYHRVHISPSIIALGNLLSVQTRDVEVWSAYFSTKELTSISEVGTDGITLTGPNDPPTTFNNLESRVYNLQVGTSGPPVISAIYEFEFPDNERPQINITGRRVVIWPFLPESRYTDSMEWKTDVIGSFENEQRIALRKNPRQTFDYKFVLDPAEFSIAKAITYQWSHRVYGIAAWGDATNVDQLIPQGSTKIPFDTSSADYREGGIILIWISNSEYEALEITTIDPDGVNLSLPLSKDFSYFLVMPLRFARTMKGMKYKRSHNEVIEASGAFLVSSNSDLADESSYPVYRSKTVMNKRSAANSPLEETVLRPMDVSDNLSGPIEIDVKDDWVRQRHNLSFATQDRDEIWNIRQFFHARKGKQKAFWLPSWNNDFKILNDIGATTQSLSVDYIAYNLYYEVRDAMIVLNDGTEIFTRITQGVDNNDGTETLLLQDPIGHGFNASEVKTCMFMIHARLDADTINFNFGENNKCEVRAIVTETPE